jgi:hypothetical protein
MARDKDKLSDEEIELVDAIVDTACHDIAYHLGLSSDDAVYVVQQSIRRAQIKNDLDSEDERIS